MKTKNFVFAICVLGLIAISNITGKTEDMCRGPEGMICKKINGSYSCCTGSGHTVCTGINQESDN